MLLTGCKPEPQKIPSPPHPQLYHDRNKVDDLLITTEDIIPIQMDVAPEHRSTLKLVFVAEKCDYRHPKITKKKRGD
jgi:hypothetical protein